MTRLAIDQIIQPSAAKTADANSAEVFPTRSVLTAEIFVDVTLVSGTSPTADFVVETSIDGGVTWFEQARISAVTAISQNSVAIVRGEESLGSSLRVRWELGGTTPSFTFSITVVGAE